MVRKLGGILLFLLAVVLLLPDSATAQSQINGVIRDESGGVLPGVTVEASSPVLIEKVRTAVTDDQGRYTIVDLRPGVYRITFTLTGFNTVVREGIEVPGGVAVTANADLKVGALEETITVSGQTPLVDVTQATRTQVLTRDLIDALPSTRNIMSVGHDGAWHSPRHARRRRVAADGADQPARPRHRGEAHRAAHRRHEREQPGNLEPAELRQRRAERRGDGQHQRASCGDSVGRSAHEHDSEGRRQQRQRQHFLRRLRRQLAEQQRQRRDARAELHQRQRHRAHPELQRVDGRADLAGQAVVLRLGAPHLDRRAGGQRRRIRDGARRRARFAARSTSTSATCSDGSPGRSARRTSSPCSSSARGSARARISASGRIRAPARSAIRTRRTTASGRASSRAR